MPERVPPAVRVAAGNQVRRGAGEMMHAAGLAHRGGQGVVPHAVWGGMNQPMPHLNDRPMNGQLWMDPAAFDNPEVQARLAANNHLMNRAILAHMMAGGGGMRRFAHPALGGGMFQQGGMPFGGAVDATARRQLWSRRPALPASQADGGASAGMPLPEATNDGDRDVKHFARPLMEAEAGKQAVAVSAYREKQHDPARPLPNSIRVLSPGDGQIAIADGLVYCRAVALYLIDKTGKRVRTVVTHFEGSNSAGLAADIMKIRDDWEGGGARYELAAVHAGETLYKPVPGVSGGVDMNMLTQNLLKQIQPGLEMEYGSKLNVNSKSAEGVLRKLQVAHVRRLAEATAQTSFIARFFAGGKLAGLDDESIRMAAFNFGEDRELTHYSASHAVAGGDAE